MRSASAICALSLPWISASLFLGFATHGQAQITGATLDAHISAFGIGSNPTEEVQASSFPRNESLTRTASVTSGGVDPSTSVASYTASTVATPQGLAFAARAQCKNEAVPGPSNNGGMCDTRDDFRFTLPSAVPFTFIATAIRTNPQSADEPRCYVSLLGPAGEIAFVGRDYGHPDSVSITVSGVLQPGNYLLRGYCEANLLNRKGVSTSATYCRLSVGAPVDPFSVWKQGVLGSASVPDDADPDCNGLTALQEYALALPSISDPPLLPAASLFQYPDGNRLRLFLKRDPARHDVIVKVWAAADLAGPWTEVATSTLGSPFSGPGYVGGDDAAAGVKTVEIRDVVGPETAPARFMRVETLH